MGDSKAQASRSVYRRGTELLLNGKPREAREVLESLRTSDPSPELWLALGKANLELNKGAEAARCFKMLLEEESPEDASRCAYVRLLAAAAASLEGRAEDAQALLEEVVQLDPRMEHAARALTRRSGGYERPLISF